MTIRPRVHRHQQRVLENGFMSSTTTTTTTSRQMEKCRSVPLFFCLLFVCTVMIMGSHVAAATVIKGPYPNGVPGSGYGCDRTCGGGNGITSDVHYTIHAKLETYTVPNSRQSQLGSMMNGNDATTTDVAMFTRTFVGQPNTSSPFCMDGYDGTTGPIGPCLQVSPGQTMTIRIVNDMDDGMTLLRQHRAKLETYWSMAQDPTNNLDSITWYGNATSTAEQMTISNEQDLPGWDVSFDDVNIHIHGMQVVPHLFNPMGTGNTTAEWITIQPKSSSSNSSSSSHDNDRQCFCYVFEIPNDHPQGTFFYHIHRHGSVAMQAWQGMIGYLVVGNSTSVGSPTYELNTQVNTNANASNNNTTPTTTTTIIREEPLALWEWAVDASQLYDHPDDNDDDNSSSNNSTGPPPTYIEGQFLGDLTQIFLTNNEYQPQFNMSVNETVYYRLLCAQTTTGSILYIVPQDDDDTTTTNNNSDVVIPFWVFGADGILYDKAYQKKSLVVGPGQREEVLLQFDRPGTYRIMQIILNDYQDDGELSADNIVEQIAATIVVTTPTTTTDPPISPVDISSLKFPPGMKHTIQPNEITRQVSVNFEVQSQLDVAPVPQFVINGKEFDYRFISQTVQAGSAQQWTLTSNMNYFHPFHIHVNPFQVQSVTSGYLPGVLPTGQTLEEALQDTVLIPPNQWRDTSFIAPFGVTSIYQKFGTNSIAWAGKSVFHCHFLDHEDQGMIAAMEITGSSSSPSPTDDSGDGADDSGTTDEGSVPSEAVRERTMKWTILSNRIAIASITALLAIHA